MLLLALAITAAVLVLGLHCCITGGSSESR
jgi:hypothetical protein